MGDGFIGRGDSIHPVPNKHEVFQRLREQGSRVADDVRLKGLAASGQAKTEHIGGLMRNDSAQSSDREG